MSNKVFVKYGLVVIISAVLLFYVKLIFIDDIEVSSILDSLISFLGIIISIALISYQMQLNTEEQIKVEYIKSRPAVNFYYQNSNHYSSKNIVYLYKYTRDSSRKEVLDYLSYCKNNNQLWTLTLSIANNQPIHNIVVHFLDSDERYYIEKVSPDTIYALILTQQVKKEGIRKLFASAKKGIEITYSTEMKERCSVNFNFVKYDFKDFWYLEKSDYEKYSLSGGEIYYGHHSCISINDEDLA